MATKKKATKKVRVKRAKKNDEPKFFVIEKKGPPPPKRPNRTDAYVEEMTATLSNIEVGQTFVMPKFCKQRFKKLNADYGYSFRWQIKQDNPTVIRGWRTK